MKRRRYKKKLLDLVLPSFTGFFSWLSWVSLGLIRFDRVFLGFHWVLMDYTGFFTGFGRFLQALAGFSLVLLGFTGFYWV